MQITFKTSYYNMPSASQDWNTTHAYTYRPPNITPGYTGYLPQQRFAYGDTFGNASAENFQSRRNIILLSSIVRDNKKYKPPTVEFPTVYSNDPALVLANRNRTRERWMAAQKYTRSSEGTKEEELQTFFKRCQSHREYYKDGTGTVARVDEFLLPKLITLKRIEAVADRTPQSTVQQKQEAHQAMIASEYIKRSHSTKNTARRRGNCRQRAIRDQVFENR